jgi:hypothetical protein
MVVPETITFTKGNGSLLTASTILPFKVALCANKAAGIKISKNSILIVFIFFSIEY